MRTYCFLGFIFIALSALCFAQEEQENPEVIVFILGNDNTIFEGYLGEFQDGYYVLHQLDKSIRFSPEDIKGIFESKREAEKIKRFIDKRSEAALKEKTIIGDDKLLETLVRAQEDAARIMQSENPLSQIRKLFIRARYIFEHPEIIMQGKELRDLGVLVNLQLPENKREQLGRDFERAQKKIRKSRLSLEEKKVILYRFGVLQDRLRFAVWD